MVWRGDIEKHYNNVTKAFEVLDLMNLDDIKGRNSVRSVILNELIKSCECIIDWIDDANNVNSEIASLFIQSFSLGYDIKVIIEARTFIYVLLDKPLSELLK